MKKAITLVVATACLGLSGFGARAEEAAAANVPKPKTYALVAAVGDQFTFVRQKMGTGSHLEPFYRKVVKVPNNGLNLAALRGLDKALGESDPTSQRVFLSLPAEEMDGVPPAERENRAIAKVIGALEKMPQRADWDKIMVLTPSYRQSEFNGMGSKLNGFGVYSQPLYSGSTDDGNGGSIDLDGAGLGEETVDPSNKTTRSKRYLAPYSYIQIWVLDPKTLQVLERQYRYDNQKLFDPMDTAIDIDKSVTAEYLAKRVATMIETSTGKVLRQTEVGTRIDIGEIRPVKPGEKGADKAVDKPADGKK
jgi:hypothetical protein